MLAQGARISWEYPHASDRARQRGITKLSAERIIRTGFVIAVRSGGTRRERWRISGVTLDERELIVVVAPDGESVIRVVTTFWRTSHVPDH